ncbi:hypothetical protein PG993_008441 [Apiospora rasikravindrae]|uniref:Secreted protein n=1 Tax=Apiospora rasikravindrae TaxID=990691 RepID=A0ABR1T0C8_9PEZI
MHFLRLLPLAAAVSAIDFYFHKGWNCDGASMRCNGINPGVCCNTGGNTEWFSAAWRGVPPEWSISCESHVFGGCNRRNQKTNSNGANWVCHGYNHIGTGNSGGVYFFNNKKRDEPQECTSTQKADTLRLADGTEYHVADLEGDLLDELLLTQVEISMLESAVNGTAADAISPKFQSLRIEQ